MRKAFFVIGSITKGLSTAWRFTLKTMNLTKCLIYAFDMVKNSLYYGGGYFPIVLPTQVSII